MSPAKNYSAVYTEVIQSNSVLLSGASTQNSPTSARLNIMTPTAATVNAALITAYEVLNRVEPATQSAKNFRDFWTVLRKKLYLF